MKLYEIDSKIQSLIDQDTGEVMNPQEFENLAMQRDEKIENIALACKNLAAEVEALKAEKQAFEARQKAAENRLKWLKGYLVYVLDGQKFKSTRVEVSFRKSEAVVIDGDVPEEYLVYKPEPDKTSIKQALKAGLDVSGCRLEIRNNISVR